MTALRTVLERAYGRPLGRPSADALDDAIRRGAHAARHLASPRRRVHGDVFNLDLHVAVIADVRDQLHRRGLGLVDWTLSAHHWVVNRQRDPVAIVNERTWHSFGPRMVKRFQRAYGSYLREFRGFVATYPPCFALLYEGLGPTLAIAATRYEWPFTNFGPGWEWLDDRLRAGVESGWLTLAANNRADADYLEHYTGLKAAYIPSACAYPGLTYTGTRSPVVISWSNEDLAASTAAQLRHEAIPLRSGLGLQYSWADLYDHRAFVFIPYNVSVMTLFECYTACVPTYVPSRAFLTELLAKYPADILGTLSFCQVTGHPAARRPRGLDLNDTNDPAVIDWYLDRADFYDAEWMPLIRQFDSWEHLDHLLATDDLHAVSAEMASARPERLQRIAKLWNDMPWLRELSR